MIFIYSLFQSYLPDMSTPIIQSVQGVSFVIQVQAVLSKLTLMGNPAGFQYITLSHATNFWESEVLIC